MKEQIKSILAKFSLEFLEEPFGFVSSSSRVVSSLKNIHDGERCFIVGNGPSINLMDIAKLNEEYTFAVNGIFYKTEEIGFRPYYYVVEDCHVVQDNIKKICDYMPRDGGVKFLPSRFRWMLRESMGKSMFLNFNRGFYDNRSPYFETPRFSVDASRKVYCGQSVTIANLQLAYFMGFKEVYLIGMDFSYQIPSSALKDGDVIESTDDDINHFHPEYFGKGKKWHDPKLHNVIKSYKLCKLMYEIDGRKIYNATVGGKLDLFERVDFASLFE